MRASQILIILILATTATAQIEAWPATQETTPRTPLEEIIEVIVTATRTSRPLANTPRSVTIVSKQRLLERGLAVAIDSLDDQMGVWVEKRTGTTSDIVLRGLSGGNILAVVDGHTLSTFWGEGGFAGDDMYGKVDAESLSRIEVVRGPGSLRYGANALGGVVNLITRRAPVPFGEEEATFGGRVKFYGATAATEWHTREELWGAVGSFRWIAGMSYRDIGDTRRPGRLQSPSSGTEFNLDGAFEFEFEEDKLLTLTVQRVQRDNTHRFYRPKQDNFNHRTAVSISYDATGLSGDGLIDSIHASLYYQAKEDVRRFFDRPVTQSGRILEAKGLATWDTLQGSVIVGKHLGSHHIEVGLDYEVTWGESPDDEQFTMYSMAGGPPTKQAPDSTWHGIGLFVTDEWELSDAFELHAGLRAQHYIFATNVDSFFVDPGGQPELAEFTSHQTTVSASLSLLYHPTEEDDIWINWTRGMRQFAPNFGIRKMGFGILVPNALLDPVTSNAFELGWRHHAPSWRAEAALYYTRFNSFQNIVAGSFQGQNFYDFDQNGVLAPDERVYVLSAGGNAYVYGIEASFWGDLHRLVWDGIPDGFSFRGGLMFNFGTDVTNNEPLRHTHPLRGVLSLRYDEPLEDRWWIECSLDLVGRFDRIPSSRLTSDPGYRVDPQNPMSGLLRPYGLPGYSVWDVRGGWNITDDVTLTLGIDNMGNKKYRTAHSRWDAPAFNAWASVEVRF